LTCVYILVPGPSLPSPGSGTFGRSEGKDIGGVKADEKSPYAGTNVKAMSAD